MSAERRLQRAVALAELDRTEEAADELAQALQLEPNNALIHASLAQCLAELDRLNEAAQQAQTAVALAPDVPEIHRILSGVWLACKNRQAAEKAIRESLSLDPTDPSSWAMLAQVHIAYERWQKALEAAEKGLEHDPEHRACHQLRLAMLSELGDHATAEAARQKALAHSPEDAWTLTTQGWRCLELRRPDQAQQHFREALRVDPELQWAITGLGEALRARHPLYRQALPSLIRYKQQGTPSLLWLGGFILAAFLVAALAANPWLAIALAAVSLAVCFSAMVTWPGGPARVTLGACTLTATVAGVMWAVSYFFNVPLAPEGTGAVVFLLIVAGLSSAILLPDWAPQE